MTAYLIDTNTVSYIIKGNPPAVRERLQSVPMTRICISAITKAELLTGVEKKPEATRLRETVLEFLNLVEVRPWDGEAAETYARMRSHLERSGKTLGNMDMLIAAHAAAIGAILVTNDAAFRHVGEFLRMEDWTLPAASA